MSQTATNFINLIKKEYPVRGRDNDSQGFRDNFTNISRALETINSDVTNLENIAVLTNSTATFFGNTVQEANFQNCSIELWNNGTLSGNIVIDYTLGSYQVLTVESGINNIEIINWPGEGKAGHLVLSVTRANSAVTLINFVGDNVESLGAFQNPYLLTAVTNVFEIHSEYPTGSAENKLLVRLNNVPFSNTSTDSTYLSTDIFRLKHPVDPGEDHIYTVKNNTGTANASVIESKIGANGVTSNLALVPNRITANIVFGSWSSPTLTTATQFQVTSVDGIQAGATFNVITTNTTLTVVDAVTTNSTIICTPPFPTGIGTGSVTFRNPSFSDFGESTAFPVVVTMVDQPATTSTGRLNVLKGSVYANTTTLEVTFRDYGDGIQNTFTATVMPVTTVTDNGLTLANTEFVHSIMPAGAVIMWYGINTNIPYGWGVCDGSTYTDPVSNVSVKSPDLRNKFVIGANATTVWNGDDALNSRVATSSVLGASTSTGGTAVAAIVSHNHETTSTITTQPHFHSVTDPGHQHILTNLNGVLAGNDIARADIDSDDRNCLAGSVQLEKQSQNAQTGISIDSTVTIVNSNITVLHTGTVAENNNTANIPPFYALYYIIKWAGAR